MIILGSKNRMVMFDIFTYLWWLCTVSTCISLTFANYNFPTYPHPDSSSRKCYKCPSGYRVFGGTTCPLSDDGAISFPNCVECPNGYFNSNWTFSTTCNKKTQCHNYDNMVVLYEGGSNINNVCDCKEGYKFTNNKEKCVKIATPGCPTSAPASTCLTSLPITHCPPGEESVCRSTTTVKASVTAGVPQQQCNSECYVTIGGAVVIAIASFVAGILFMVFKIPQKIYKRLQNCRGGSKTTSDLPRRPSAKSVVGNSTAVSDENTERPPMDVTGSDQQQPLLETGAVHEPLVKYSKAGTSTEQDKTRQDRLLDKVFRAVEKHESALLDWGKVLRQVLGLYESDIETINTKYDGKPSMKLMNGLGKWKTRKGRDATPENLARSFEKEGLRDVQEEILNIISADSSRNEEDSRVATEEPPEHMDV